MLISAFDGIMEYYLLFVIFALIGSVCAYFNSAVTGITNDELDEISDLDSVNSESLSKLIRHKEVHSSPLSLAEMFFYSLSVSLALAHTVLLRPSDIAIEYADLAIVYVVFSVVILLLRTFLTALGHKYSKFVLSKQWLVAYLISSWFAPIAFMLEKLFCLVSGHDSETALDELDDLVESAHEDGELEHGEYRLLKNIMQFADVMVSDVMTPRTVVFSLNANITASAALQSPELQMYSRIPIWHGSSLDEGAQGYVMSKDIMKAVIQGRGETPLSGLSRDLHFIPDNASLDVALESFLERRQHLFLVVDEYGGIDGLITMEDVMETILGKEIVDEADRFVDLRELAKQRRDRRIATSAVRDNTEPKQ